MFQPMMEQNFRYTFGKCTLVNIDAPAGLYTFGDTVLSVDKFGEVRVALETPVNNPNKLLKDLLRAIR